MENSVNDKEFLKKQFEEEGKTVEEVSEEFNIPVFMLVSRANRYGIKAKRDMSKMNPFLRRMQEKKNKE